MTAQQELLQKLIEAQVLAADANRQAILAADANIKAVEENTRQIQSLSYNMQLHNAKQEQFEALVAKHETALYGKDDRKGYLQRFDIIEDKVIGTLKNISIATWFVAGSIFSGVGVWIWQLVKP